MDQMCLFHLQLRVNRTSKTQLDRSREDGNVIGGSRCHQEVNCKVFKGQMSPTRKAGIIKRTRCAAKMTTRCEFWWHSQLQTPFWVPISAQHQHLRSPGVPQVPYCALTLFTVICTTSPLKLGGLTRSERRWPAYYTPAK